MARVCRGSGPVKWACCAAAWLSLAFAASEVSTPDGPKVTEMQLQSDYREQNRDHIEQYFKVLEDFHGLASEHKKKDAILHFMEHQKSAYEGLTVFSQTSSTIATLEDDFSIQSFWAVSLGNLMRKFSEVSGSKDMQRIIGDAHARQENILVKVRNDIGVLLSSIEDPGVSSDPMMYENFGDFDLDKVDRVVADVRFLKQTDGIAFDFASALAPALHCIVRAEALWRIVSALVPFGFDSPPKIVRSIGMGRELDRLKTNPATDIQTETLADEFLLQSTWAGAIRFIETKISAFQFPTDAKNLKTNLKAACSHTGDMMRNFAKKAEGAAQRLEQSVGNFVSKKGSNLQDDVNFVGTLGYQQVDRFAAWSLTPVAHRGKREGEDILGFKFEDVVTDLIRANRRIASAATVARILLAKRQPGDAIPDKVSDDLIRELAEGLGQQGGVTFSPDVMASTSGFHILTFWGKLIDALSSLPVTQGNAGGPPVLADALLIQVGLVDRFVDEVNAFANPMDTAASCNTLQDFTERFKTGLHSFGFPGDQLDQPQKLLQQVQVAAAAAKPLQDDGQERMKKLKELVEKLQTGLPQAMSRLTLAKVVDMLAKVSRGLGDEIGPFTLSINEIKTLKEDIENFKSQIKSEIQIKQPTGGDFEELKAEIKQRKLTGSEGVEIKPDQIETVKKDIVLLKDDIEVLKTHIQSELSKFVDTKNILVNFNWFKTNTLQDIRKLEKNLEIIMPEIKELQRQSKLSSSDNIAKLSPNNQAVGDDIEVLKAEIERLTLSSSDIVAKLNQIKSESQSNQPAGGGFEKLSGSVRILQVVAFVQCVIILLLGVVLFFLVKKLWQEPPPSVSEIELTGKVVGSFDGP